ncbi:phytanoyl-CoA dioxygenase family protein [Sphingomonas sp. UYP23]
MSSKIVETLRRALFSQEKGVDGLSGTPQSPPRYLADDINLDNQVPWFMSYDYKDDERYLALPDDVREQADRFMRDGYIVFENAVSPDLCDRVTSEFRSLCSRNSDYFDQFRNDFGYLERVINIHLTLPVLVEMFASARPVLAFQDALFGARTSIYTSLYFEKGSGQTLHRDTPYFTTRPEYCYFGTWFALEDADPGNGCLEVIAGGHLVPELDRLAFARSAAENSEIGSINNQLFDKYQGDMLAECERRGLSSRHVPMKRGDVLIWHPQLPHGGGFIAEPTRTRNSIVMHTVPEGCPVYHAYAFFDPTSSLPAEAPWAQDELFDRRFAAHDTIEVMHRSPRHKDSFL